MQLEFHWRMENFDVIIPKGIVFPLRKSFLFKYTKKYNFKNLKNINV